MKIITYIFLLTASTAFAQNTTIESGVYTLNNLKTIKQGKHEMHQLLNGSSQGLELLSIDLITVSDTLLNYFSPKDDIGRMIIIKDGRLTLSLDAQEKKLGAGSVALIMPRAGFCYRSSLTQHATLYLLQFKPKKARIVEQTDSANLSLMIDFEKLEFKPHDKGGIRNYHHQSTALFNYAEMHFTTLNSNIKSHEPHTHAAAEIVLMISGNTQMQIADKFYKATAGDLYFLESNSSHAIQNTGNK